MENDQIGEKLKKLRPRQRQRQSNVYINSVVEFTISKRGMLNYSENIFAPHYEIIRNSFDCVENEEIKVILRL